MLMQNAIYLISYYILSDWLCVLLNNKNVFLLTGHPKIKLFITQGGLQSTDEAINALVPLLAVPLLGDQWYNAEKYVRYKIGKKLEMGTLKEVELMSAIESIIADER